METFNNLNLDKFVKLTLELALHWWENINYYNVSVILYFSIPLGKCLEAKPSKIPSLLEIQYILNVQSGLITRDCGFKT